MKNKSILFSLFLMGLLSACGDSKGTDNEGTRGDSTAVNVTATPEPQGKPVTISGTIKGLTAGQTVTLEMKKGASSVSLGTVTASENGSFEIKTKVDHPNIFRLITGAAFVWLILEGDETVKINAEIANNTIGTAKIEGSPQSQELMSVVLSNPKPEALVKYLGEKKDQPLVNLFLIGRLDASKHLKQYEMVGIQTMLLEYQMIYQT
jgi:hypothetical protein